MLQKFCGFLKIYLVQYLPASAYQVAYFFPAEKKMANKKLLYYFVGKSTFTGKDIDILAKNYTVLPFNFEFGKKWLTPFQLLQQFFFTLWHLFSAKACVIQLAGFHSVIPVLLFKISGKKSIIIAAGTDCHKFPQISYGNFHKRLLGMATAFSFRNAAFILPKHESLWHCKYDYDESGRPEQGIKAFVKGELPPYVVIKNGYDATVFQSGNDPRSSDFITVSGLLHRTSQQKLKGIDLVLELAKRFPEKTFTIVGVNDVNAFPATTSNVTLLPSVSNDKLPALFSKHRFYLQLSMAEGFPNALCEAMLCECVPIGSGVFSIPEIIGETGFILNRRDRNELESLIRKALSTDLSNSGKAARKRIAENYTLEKRESLLLETLKRIV